MYTPRIATGVLTMAMLLSTPTQGAEKFEEAIFAGGCFWCVEHLFDEVDGVVETISGYTGGQQANPSYPQVSAGGTGHAEAVLVRFDPAKVSYADLLRRFWRGIDPTTPNRQFCDSGEQYRSAIFTMNAAQKQAALDSLKEVERDKPFKEPIVTQIQSASTFYPAEEYHQDYHHRNPLRYGFYRANCGRDQRLQELWGDAPAAPQK